MSLNDNVKRARTAGDKHDRRASILAAARALIHESGFESVTMAVLAKRAGLAKGTLYLYVKTKEEVFILLMEEALQCFFLQVRPVPDTLEEIVESLVTAAQKTDLFVDLTARLAPIIEVNLSQQVLVDFKRMVMLDMSVLAWELSKKLCLSPEIGLQAAKALFTTLQGAAQSCIEPKGGLDALPDDVFGFYQNNRFDMRFRDGAKLVLHGAIAMQSAAPRG